MTFKLGLIVWVIFFLVYMWILPWKYKKKISPILGGISIILILSSAVLLVKGIFIDQKMSESFWFCAKYGLLCFVTIGATTFFSNSAWAERDESKDNIKFRLAFGICIKCKKKIPRLATKCPYCLTDLSH